MKLTIYIFLFIIKNFLNIYNEWEIIAPFIYNKENYTRLLRFFYCF